MSYEPPVPPPSYSAARQNRTNSLAIASLVCGIAGAVITILVPSLLAVVFGHMSLRQMSQTGEQGRGLAITGLVLGYVVLAISLALGVLMFFVFKSTAAVA